MYLMEAKWSVRQFVADQYWTDLEKSLATASEKVSSIVVLDVGLEGEYYWDLAELTERSDLAG